ncbi:MAG TPA: hypothetical protein VGF55_17980 [Gemmataceae bacterium]
MLNFRRIALLAAVLAAGGPARGQSVKLPETVAGKPGAWIVVPAEADGGPVRWYLPDPGLTEVPLAALFGDDWAAHARGRVFTAEVPGRHRVVAYCGKGDAASPPAVCTVVVGESPAPPAPTPPSPAPLPGAGLRVLIVYETAELSTYPKDQLSVLYGSAVRGYLDAHCAKGPDGKTAEWRIWDQNVPTGAEAKVWQDAMSRKRDKLPWLVVSNGASGFEGPLPGTVGETLKLLKQYGGD